MNRLNILVIGETHHLAKNYCMDVGIDYKRYAFSEGNGIMEMRGTKRETLTVYLVGGPSEMVRQEAMSRGHKIIDV